MWHIYNDGNAAYICDVIDIIHIVWKRESVHWKDMLGEFYDLDAAQKCLQDYAAQHPDEKPFIEHLVHKTEQKCGGPKAILGRFDNLDDARQCLRDYVHSENARWRKPWEPSSPEIEYESLHFQQSQLVQRAGRSDARGDNRLP